MRTLQFNVEGLILSKDPNCNFDKIVPCTNGYLQAQFQFSEEWNGYLKVAEFSSGNHEYTPQVLDKNNSCMIPQEALKRSIFRIRILGRQNDNRLITNRILVYQKGGNK